GDKRQAARRLMSRLWATRNGCLSMQVLQEFYVNITQKVAEPLLNEDAAAVIEDLSAWTLHCPQIDDLARAIRLQQQARLSFWDAMVVTSAVRLGCVTLWSEDLSHGRVVGGVQIMNPFA
ncbi:MAG TPA: PIN domain-containing protein, partial [Limnochordia bacterium]|nr:PIN domain-containing protein [Limnochordia bacterium]